VAFPRRAVIYAMDGVVGLGGAVAAATALK